MTIRSEMSFCFRCIHWQPSRDPAEKAAAQARIDDNLRSEHRVNQKLARDPLAGTVFRKGLRSCSARGKCIGLSKCVRPEELVRVFLTSCH